MKNVKDLEQTKCFLKKKNKAGRLTVPDFKIFYKAITVKTLWY